MLLVCKTLCTQTVLVTCGTLPRFWISKSGCTDLDTRGYSVWLLLGSKQMLSRKVLLFFKNKSIHNFLYPSVKLLYLGPSPRSQEGKIPEGSNASPLGYFGPCRDKVCLCLFSASLGRRWVRQNCPVPCVPLRD